MPASAPAANPRTLNVGTLSEWLSVSDFAEQAGVSTKTVRRWIKGGLVTAVRLGPKLLRIDPRDLSRLTLP